MHKIGQSAGKTWAYLLGVYLGDGCVTKQVDQPVFRLNTIDADFAEATKAALAHFTDRPVGVHTYAVSKSSKPNHSLRCGDAEICKALVAECNGKLKLPDWLETAERDVKLAFIAGVMDSEGFVCFKGQRGQAMIGIKTTDVWFEDFLRIAQSVGIQHGKIGVEVPRKEGYRVPKRVTFKMQSWVDAGAYFNIARKQDKVTEWAKLPYKHVPRNLRDYMPSTACEGGDDIARSVSERRGGTLAGVRQ